MHNLPDVLILCGGAGLRLREVTGDGPKSMASVAGRPFLELLLEQLRRCGFRRVILAVGYQKEIIRSHFGDGASGLDLTYSEESAPLGTGGALRNAANLIESDVALVMNGDSYTDIELRCFLAAHFDAAADVSLALVPADGRNDCGNVRLDHENSVISFEEKRMSAADVYVNAGIYIIRTHLLRTLPEHVQMSLEREVFPAWLTEGKRFRGVIYPTLCVDIGTPERYRMAQVALAQFKASAV